ncbi:MAG: FG-GAP-like repeat-containing protein, partial [Flavisolibacter sp.]
MIIGLGKVSKIDSMIVTWPNRSFIKFDNVAVNQTKTIKEDDEKDTLSNSPPKVSGETFFTPVKANFEKHQENDVIDFYTERNVPRLLSKEGPRAAVGDVNGDGLDDIFIGGTPDHAGQLYIQSPDGGFKKKDQPGFAAFQSFEDVAVLLFDCDHDGDLDLLICPGGNASSYNTRELQLRLFKNDGKGNFSLDPSAFPNTGMNISVAIANDINGDGYPDLFVGARSFPQVYGVDPTSFIFINDGQGHFKDVAKEKNPEIANIGMVCSAVWADVSGDAQKELVIVGEWMTPRIFSYNKSISRFEEVKNTGLEDMYGWWQSVAAADVNGDGKEDLVLGNIGENFYLRPDREHPVRLWINDFDQNGSMEKMMTYTVNGRDMPVMLKKDIEDQLPSIKKHNLKNEEYSHKAIQDLFSKELLEKSVVKQFNFKASVVAINKGDGSFSARELPVMSQLSCINVIHCMDVNGDGKVDLVTGGNQFGFLPQFERLDASFGDVMLNDGRGGFLWQENRKTGLTMRGEMRDIAEVKSKGKKFLLFLQNNEYPLLFQLNDFGAKGYEGRRSK